MKTSSLLISLFLLAPTTGFASQLFCSFTEKVSIETEFHFAQDLPAYDRVNAPVPTAFVMIDGQKSQLIDGFVNLNGGRVLVSLNDKRNGGNFSISGSINESFFFQWIHKDGAWIKGECKIIEKPLM